MHPPAAEQVVGRKRKGQFLALAQRERIGETAIYLYCAANVHLYCVGVHRAAAVGGCAVVATAVEHIGRFHAQRCARGYLHAGKLVPRIRGCVVGKERARCCVAVANRGVGGLNGYGGRCVDDYGYRVAKRVARAVRGHYVATCVVRGCRVDAE